MAYRACTLLLWASAFAAHGAPAEPYVFPNYTEAAAVTADCGRMLADLKAQAAQLAAPAADGDVLAGLDAMTRRYEDTLGPLSLLTAVHPDKAVRDATEACTLKFDAFYTAFLQNEPVYERLKQAQPADDIDRRYRSELLDAFEDSGVGLPPAQRERAKAISTEITGLSQAFRRRLREDKTRLAFTQAELKGVPAPVWQQAPRDAKGRYLLGLDYPTLTPVLENAVDPRTRARMRGAFMRLGGTENLAVLQQLGDLRREYAALFGFDSYADFVLRRRMAQNEAEVQRFLATVKDAVERRELDDLALLREAKARHLKQPVEKTTLQRSDVAFYSERIRRARFAVDQERFRPYFPPQASLDTVFALAARLFGVSFKSLQQTLWHADARAFAVSDSTSGELLGTLFVDLYPRDDKYNHAAVWTLRNVSTLAERRPAAALVVNFDRRGLTLDEFETLLHEFGHALHSLLSKTRYAGQGGTSVQTDFVEAPSQMLEDWVYHPEVLALMQQVCKTCKPVPKDLLAQAERARHFGKGYQYARQHLFARYDLALHGKTREAPLALWKRMEATTPLGHAEGSMFPAGFAHIAGGYAAGYYSYLWSQVLAEDLRTAFDGKRLDAATGRRYRDTVLANGGQMAPAELMQRFLGRPSDSRAFFEFLNRQ